MICNRAAEGTQPSKIHDPCWLEKSIPSDCTANGNIISYGVIFHRQRQIDAHIACNHGEW